MEIKVINSFLLDCGRKYFSIDDIKNIVDCMYKNKFNTLIIAFGNDGFRFILDDMEINFDDYYFSSDKVKKAITSANKRYCDNGEKNELTQAEMESIIQYCRQRQIQVIPLFNSPGHMNSLLWVMEELGLKNVRYKSSKTTIDFDNKDALMILNYFITKYIQWFHKQKCNYFHLGCDEYANDVLKSGFKSLQNLEDYRYDRFVDYVNYLVSIVIENDMIPIMFNDGMYFGDARVSEKFNQRILCSYWTKGWPGYELADVKIISDNGHSVINTNKNWYYVLGRYTRETCNQDFTFEKANEGMVKFKKNDIDCCKGLFTIGTTFCLWCDQPEVPYDAIEKENLESLLESFGKNVFQS